MADYILSQRPISVYDSCKGRVIIYITIDHDGADTGPERS